MFRLISIADISAHTRTRVYVNIRGEAAGRVCYLGIAVDGGGREKKGGKKKSSYERKDVRMREGTGGKKTRGRWSGQEEKRGGRAAVGHVDEAQ